MSVLTNNNSLVQQVPNVTRARGDNNPRSRSPVPNRNISAGDVELMGYVLKGSVAEALNAISSQNLQGASLDRKIHQGKTLLHLAAQSGNTEIACELIQRGASVNTLDEKGRTPMEIALINKHEELASILFSMGGTKESIDRKVLSHIWGIKGQSQISENQSTLMEAVTNSKDQKKVSYEGMPYHLIEKPFINYTLAFFQTEFKKMNSPLNPEAISRAVRKIPDNNSRPPEEIAEEVENGELILQHTGWPKHATGIGFDGKTVIKTNCARQKGVLTPKQPVSKYYEMHKTDNLVDCIAKIQKKDSRVFFKKTIDTKLQLVFQGELIKTAQKGGYCSWDSLKALFHAALERECAKIFSDPNEAKQEALRIYKAWKYFVSKVSYKDYVHNSSKRDVNLIGAISRKDTEREAKGHFWGNQVFAPRIEASRSVHDDDVPELEALAPQEKSQGKLD